MLLNTFFGKLYSFTILKRRLGFLVCAQHRQDHNSQVDEDAHPLLVVDHEQAHCVKEDDGAAGVGLSVSQNVRVCRQVAYDSQQVVASPLDAAARNPVLGVVLGVVDVAVLHVGNVEAGDVAKVAEYPEVGVAWDDARLEYLLANNTGKGMRSLRNRNGDICLCE